MRRLPWAKRRVIFEAMKHKPTLGQLTLHEWDGNDIIFAGGMGAGKSEVAGKEMAAHVANAASKEGLEQAIATIPPNQHRALIESMTDGGSFRIKEGELFILAGPTYEAPQTEFKVVLRTLKKMGLIKKASTPKTGPWELTTIFGTQLVTRTLSDPEDVRAWNCAGACICEAGKVSEDGYLALMGRVFRTNGFMILTGTIEASEPWYQEYLQEWSKSKDKLSVMLPSWSNTVAFPGGEFDEKIERLAQEYGGRDSRLFLEKVAAKLVKLSGLVIDQFNYDIHVKDVRWNGGDVELAIDPGSAHTYAVEVIQANPHGQLQIIDEIYRQDLVTEQVISIMRDKPYWNHITGGVIDRTAVDRRGHVSSTAWKSWNDAGIHLRSNYVLVQDGIDQIQTRLGINPATGEPKLVINPKCKGLIYEFGGQGKPPIVGMGPWRRMDRGDGAYGKPQNVDDDASKALGYYVVDRYGKVMAKTRALTASYTSGLDWSR